MRSNTQPSRSSRRIQTFLVLASLLALTGVTGIIVACSSGSSTAASGMSQVHVSLSDPATCAAPDGPYSAVWVTVTDVQASTSSTAGTMDSSSWVDLTPNLTKNNEAVQLNLLGEANNQCFLATLGDNLELQAGSYQQIRLILASSTTGLTLVSNPGNGTTDPAVATSDMCNGMANCIVVGTQTSPLQLSSEAKTGLKIPSGQIAGGAFTISAGQTKDLNIDFNTCASIVKEGNGMYRLKPVLHAGEVGTTSASLNGTIVDSTGAGIANAMVAVEQQDSDTPTVDRIVQVARTASDGTWVICPLAGDSTKPYDLVIIGSDSTGILQSPVVITGVSAGSAIGKITLALPTGLTTPLTAATAVADLNGQVDTTSASGAISMDVAASVLEQVNGQLYTIPLPVAKTATVDQTDGATWLNLQTEGSQTPACKDANNYCANYDVLVPVTAAFYGAWSGSSVSLTAPATAYASYMMDGIASGASDTSITPAGTTGCTPNEMQSTALALTSSTTYPASVSELDFTACQ